jgi:hypothetical protein
METKILLILITSITSIILAIVSLLSNYLNNRKLVKANRELEVLKFEIEKKREKFKISDKSLRDKLNSIENHISLIQVFKDNLFLIQSSITNSLDTETALFRINKSKDELCSFYETNSQYLTKEDGSLSSAHSAKNLSLTIGENLNNLFLKREFVNISEKERLSIEKSKGQLTELQNVLRDIRFKIISNVS